MTRALTTLISIAILLAAQALAAPDVYRVFKGDSSVAFSIDHLAGRAHGKFNTFDGTLNYSKADPESSTVGFVIEAASVDSDNQKRDDHLRTADYFGVTQYPEMTFSSKAFKSTGKNSYMVTGPLVIKGHSKNISVPVKLVRAQRLWVSGEESLRFTASFEIDRTEFGVGERSSLIGDQVQVKLDLDFRAK